MEITDAKGQLAEIFKRTSDYVHMSNIFPKMLNLSLLHFFKSLLFIFFYYFCRFNVSLSEMLL